MNQHVQSFIFLVAHDRLYFKECTKDAGSSRLLEQTSAAILQYYGSYPILAIN